MKHKLKQNISAFAFSALVHLAIVGGLFVFSSMSMMPRLASGENKTIDAYVVLPEKQKRVLSLSVKAAQNMPMKVDAPLQLEQKEKPKVDLAQMPKIVPLQKSQSLKLDHKNNKFLKRVKKEKPAVKALVQIKQTPTLDKKVTAKRVKVKIAKQPIGQPDIKPAIVKVKNKVNAVHPPENLLEAVQSTALNEATFIDVSEIKVIKQKVIYPYQSRMRRETGKVLIRVSLNQESQIMEVSVHESSGFMRLDKAALSAAKKWQYFHKGKAEILVPFTFTRKKA